MGKGTNESPYTRKDILRRIRRNGSTAGGLDLSEKVFEENIDLRELQLQRIILNEAVLEKAHLEGALLSNAQLKGAFLSEARLEEARLSGAHLECAELTSTHLEGARLAGAHLEGARLFDAYLLEANLINAFLDKTSFAAAHLQGIHLSHAKLTDETEFGSTDWGNYVLGEEKEGDNKNRRHQLHWAADVYRRLKIWYTRAGRYDIAGRFFFREQESYRKLIQFTKPRRIKQFWALIWLWIFKLTCGYGEKPERVVVSALAVIFGLAIAYIFGGLSLPYSIYFSAISFTALGYGSWAYTPPSDWVQGLGAFESFLGVFMMALFLITFVRKMTR